MSESQPCGPDSLDARLAALANAAAILDWPLPRERDESTCCDLARVIDALLVRVARGRGALDAALGEALDVLATGNRVVRVGYSGIGDYAREKLGIAASTAQKMVRFARQLRERPLLRAAVRAGEVTVRAAEAVLPNARGDGEAAWVERARNETVRALKAAVKGTAPGSDEGSPSDEDDEKWIRTRAQIGSDERAVIDKALDLARKASCATAPKWLDPNRSRRPSQRRRPSAISGCSMPNCGASPISASAGTRSSAISRCCCARWTAGGAWGSPRSSITPSRGSGWACVRSPSARRWSGSSTKCLSYARRCARSGSRTKRRDSSRDMRPRRRSMHGSSAPGAFLASRSVENSRQTKNGRCARAASSKYGRRGARRR